MQLYFVTIHQPSWIALRRSAGLYMYSGGICGSTLPSRKVDSASVRHVKLAVCDSKIRRRHAQAIHRIRLVLAVVEYRRIGKLGLEESLRVVPLAPRTASSWHRFTPRLESSV